jgi:hypothetical protein
MRINSTKMPREIKTTTEDYQKWVVDLTGESFEVVEKRLEERLGSPDVRQFLADALVDFAEAVEGRDELLLYKAIVNFGSGMLFGKGVQRVDLAQPIDLGRKDNELLGAFDGVMAAIRLNKGTDAIRESLDAIPEVTGSKCDLGEFDGYNQEVLFVISMIALRLEGATSFLSDEETPFRQNLSQMIELVNSGLRHSDRLKIFEGMRGIFNTVETIQ